VFLDVRHLDGFRARFPGIAGLLEDVGLDPSKDLIPVNPAMHYFIGGVATDLMGRTGVPGLLAVGEVASTGLHGANRLASNSLLEGLVVGEAAGRSACEGAKRTVNGSGGGPAPPMPIVSDIRPSDGGEIDLTDIASSLRSAMWRNAGIERSGPRLADVSEMIDFWARYTLDKIFDTPEGWQTQNMLLAAALIARSSLWRKESRGAHWRSDFPEPREECRVHDRWRRGAVDAETAAVRRA
jgi:L-aspartate oxidase